MAEIRRILCPVDFSETSRAALRWAVELARRFQAELTLFHVYQAPSFTLPDGVVVGGPEALADLMRQVDDSMNAWKAEAVGLGLESVRTETALGATHPEITRHAREEGYDVICIGTHGRTGLSHVLLGSTAEKIVRHAHCPVLTVRTPGAGA